MPGASHPDRPGMAFRIPEAQTKESVLTVQLLIIAGYLLALLVIGLLGTRGQSPYFRRLRDIPEAFQIGQGLRSALRLRQRRRGGTAQQPKSELQAVSRCP